MRFDVLHLSLAALQVTLILYGEKRPANVEQIK